MGAILRAKDWGKTKWGPMETWPPCLLSMVSPFDSFDISDGVVVW